MVNRKLSYIFPLLLSVLLTACGGWGYTFNKIFYAGQPGKRVKVPVFGLFPYGFDVTESGDIYFSLTTDSSTSICRIDHDSNEIYEVIKTEYNAILPILSNNEESIMFLNDIITGVHSPFFYDLKTHKLTQLIKSYKMRCYGAKFSKDDQQLWFYGDSFDLDTLKLKNPRLHYFDIYQVDLNDCSLKKISNLYIEDFYFLMKDEEDDSFIVKIGERTDHDEIWFTRFNNKQLQLPYREPYTEGFYRYLPGSNTLIPLNITWKENLRTPIKNSKFPLRLPGNNTFSKYKNKVYICSDVGFHVIDFENSQILNIANKINQYTFETVPDSMRFYYFDLYDNGQKLVSQNTRKGEKIFVVYDIKTQTIEKEIYIDPKKFIPLKENTEKNLPPLWFK